MVGLCSVCQRVYHVRLGSAPGNQLEQRHAAQGGNLARAAAACPYLPQQLQGQARGGRDATRRGACCITACAAGATRVRACKDHAEDCSGKLCAPLCSIARGHGTRVRHPLQPAGAARLRCGPGRALALALALALVLDHCSVPAQLPSSGSAASPSVSSSSTPCPAFSPTARRTLHRRSGGPMPLRLPPGLPCCSLPWDGGGDGEAPCPRQQRQPAGHAIGQGRRGPGWRPGGVGARWSALRTQCCHVESPLLQALPLPAPNAHAASWHEPPGNADACPAPTCLSCRSCPSPYLVASSLPFHAALIIQIPKPNHTRHLSAPVSVTFLLFCHLSGNHQ